MLYFLIVAQIEGGGAIVTLQSIATHMRRPTLTGCPWWPRWRNLSLWPPEPNRTPRGVLATCIPQWMMERIAGRPDYGIRVQIKCVDEKSRNICRIKIIPNCERLKSRDIDGNWTKWIYIPKYLLVIRRALSLREGLGSADSWPYIQRLLKSITVRPPNAALLGTLSSCRRLLQ